MKIISFFIAVFFLLFACRQTAKKKNVIKSIEVQNIDLYPQYKSCSDFFEKEKQLECLMLKINNFITHYINDNYKEHFINLRDTLWVNFEIDTKGLIHYIGSIHQKKPMKDSLYEDIFKNIANKIPKMKPAIYQGRPVNFEFKIPIVNSNP